MVGTSEYAESLFDKLQPPAEVVKRLCSQQIYEKYRYSLLDINKLIKRSKMIAHRKNLDNITKSGMKQL